MQPVIASSTPKGGMLRRRVVLVADERSVAAALEDDFHRFALTLEHDGQCVTRITSSGERTPWTTCAAASAQLNNLAGAPIGLSARKSVADVDPRHQCTHQFDLAMMAIAQAARGGQRVYDATVTDPDGQHRIARLEQDGSLLIEWQLDGTTIVSAGKFAGVNLRKLDTRTLDADIEEGFLLLRRAVMVAGGRGVDLDRFDDMTQLSGHMSGACYAFQPVRLSLARRNKGSGRDFTDHPERLLAK